MKRLVLPAILALAAVAPAQQSGTGQLDASPSLFTVMAAINAAGYDAGLDSPGADPLRKAVRDELAKRQISSLAALKEFYAAHRKRTGSEDLSQYISFALSVSSPPAFQFKEKDADIPPDAAALKGLTPLLVAFYREANIDDLWRRSQPHILSVIARYHRPVLEDVEQVNAYLRQQTSGVRGRRFQIFIEPLAEPNQVQTRSYGYDYYVVVTPSPEPRAFDIRHAYLHYTLEPLTTRYREIVDRKKVLFENLDRATALDSSFKQDPLLMTTECLIKAVEARLDHKSGAVDEDLHQGFILTPYFYEQLGLYEKQETSMAEYYITLLGAIDLAKEERRLSQVEFSTEDGRGHARRRRPCRRDRPRRWKRPKICMPPASWIRPRKCFWRWWNRPVRSRCVLRLTMDWRALRRSRGTPPRRKACFLKRSTTIPSLR